MRILFSSGASATDQGGSSVEFVGPTGNDHGTIATGGQFQFDGTAVGGATWAPTGGRVAFLRSHRSRTGNSEGLVVQTVSTGAERSVDGAFMGNFSSASWSPNGRRLAAVRSGVDVDTWFTFRELVVYDLVAGTETPLGDADVAMPAWSPDGTSILFERGDELWTIDPDGSDEARLTTGDGAAWSPDSATIAFARDGQLWAIGRDGEGEVQLTTAGQNFDPNWSGDGRTIAFTSTRDGNQEIYLMRADGSGQRNVSRRPGADNEPDWRPRA